MSHDVRGDERRVGSTGGVPLDGAMTLVDSGVGGKDRHSTGGSPRTGPSRICVRCMLYIDAVYSNVV